MVESAEKPSFHRHYFTRANETSSFAQPSTTSVPFFGSHRTGLTDVISEQMTMFVSPVKRRSFTVCALRQPDLARTHVCENL